MLTRTCRTLATLSCLALTALPAAALGDALTVSETLSGPGTVWYTTSVDASTGTPGDRPHMTVFWNLTRDPHVHLPLPDIPEADGDGQHLGTAYAVIDGTLVGTSPVVLTTPGDLGQGLADGAAARFQLSGPDGRLLELRLRLAAAH